MKPSNPCSLRKWGCWPGCHFIWLDPFFRVKKILIKNLVPKKKCTIFVIILHVADCDWYWKSCVFMWKWQTISQFIMLESYDKNCEFIYCGKRTHISLSDLGRLWNWDIVLSGQIKTLISRFILVSGTYKIQLKQCLASGHRGRWK